MLTLLSLSTYLSETAERKSLPPTSCRHQSYTLNDLDSGALGKSWGFITEVLPHWLVQAAEKSQFTYPKKKFSSYIEIHELCSFVLKEFEILDLNNSY